MAWYRTGTLSLTNGSTSVTGSGTQFRLAAQPGDMLTIGSAIHEIASINSDTSVTLATAFTGTTATGVTGWAIVQTQSRTKAMNDSVSALVASLQNFEAEIDSKQASLGFTPVQNGTGAGQLGNPIKIGWSGTRLKATVDNGDLGNVVFDSNLTWAAISSKPTTLTGFGITDAQPSNASLTSIGGLAGTTGFLKKTAANTYVLDTSTYATTAMLTGYQPYDDDLAAIGAVSGTSGILTKTATNAWALDTVPRVQQGTGVGQTANAIKLGWSAGGRLKATVDSTDLGNILTDGWLNTIGGASLIGSGNITSLAIGITGNAATASRATTVDVPTTTANAPYYFVGAPNAGNAQQLVALGAVSLNPSTGALSTTALGVANNLTVGGTISATGHIWGNSGIVIASSATNQQLQVKTTSNRGWRLLNTSSGTTLNALYLQATSDDWVTSATDFVFAQTGAFTATGIVTANNFVSSSDKRLKANIASIKNPLGIIAGINGVTYQWNKLAQNKKGKKADERRIGVIAQDVEAVLPQAVFEDADGHKVLAYNDLIPVLIEGTKELVGMVDALKAEVAALRGNQPGSSTEA